MDNINKAIRETDWFLFHRQKQWLINQADTSIMAEGLLQWIDAIQDAIIADKFLDEVDVFPYKATD